MAAGSKEAQQFTAQESTSSSSSTSSVVSEARKPASAATPVRESSLAGYYTLCSKLPRVMCSVFHTSH